MSAVTKLPYYDCSLVRERAAGHWLEVFAHLAYAELSEVLQQPRKHHTCPLHGTSHRNGRGDGFRFFPDVATTGGAICNQCGAFPGGIDLLQALKGWDFQTALIHVAQYLHVEPKRRNVTRSAGELPVASVKPVSASPTVIGQPGVNAVSDDPDRYSPSYERMDEIRKLQAHMVVQQARSCADAKDRMERLWRESFSLGQGVPVPLQKYLKSRGILLRQDVLAKGDSIRFHPSLPYFEENRDGMMVMIGTFPAMIAAIRDLQGAIVTLHRSYLTTCGAKANVACARKMLPVPGDKSVSGSAIQIGGFPQDGVLGVAEGFESAASPLKVYGIPTWSCVSATIMEKFEPPKGVHTILGWEDKDLSLRGEKAMEVLNARMTEKGIRFIRMPIRRQIPSGDKSIDWNDVLVREGVLGMPSYQQLMKVIKEDNHGRF